MPLKVQGLEQDYDDNPDGDGFPEIVPENLPRQQTVAPAPTSPFFFSVFQQQQQEQQQQQKQYHGREEEKEHQHLEQWGQHVEMNGTSHRSDRSATTNPPLQASLTSSEHHFNRLRKSTSTVAFTSKSPTTADALNDTLHHVKGRGFLASTKDVNVSPKIFAEGCKLLQAAALGNLQHVKTLLRARPENIYFRDYDRRTALHVAASEGKLLVVKLLIETYDAPINRSDRWGGSPLDDAHRHRHSDVVEYLRGKGASTGSTDQTTNLITAAVTGDLDELRMLLNNSVDSSAGGKKKRLGRSSSIGSKGKSNAATVDINAGDYDKRTALHLAAAAGHTNVVAFLLQQGANPNVIDSWGGTPLDDAIRTSHIECIGIIKAKGGKVGKDKKKHFTVETSERSTTNEEKNLNIDFSELDVIDKIGSGAFGEIFKCRWRGTLVAAKCIKSSKIVKLWRESAVNRSADIDEDLTEAEFKEALADFRGETRILRSLRHPNICMLLSYSQTENFQVMISELMKCSLLDVFRSHLLNGTSMPRKTQISYAHQIAKGMNYLHNCHPPVIHRDLKPANLLVDFSGTLKITDFGLAKVRPDPKTKETEQFRMTGETGSYRFMAPEVFRHEQYTETVDIYSFAMIFYYLVSGRPPWESLSGLQAVVKASVEADRPIIYRSWDSQIASLMQRCWDENPAGRPSFEIILDELNDYSQNALKMDVETLGNESGARCCVIS